MYVEESHFIDTHDPSFLGVEGGGGVGCYATSSTNSMEEQHMNMKVHVPTFSLDDLTSHQHQHHQTEEAMAQAAFELEHEFNTHLMQDVLNDPNNLNNNGSMQHIQQPFDHQHNWASQIQEMQNMQNMSTQCYNSSSFNPSQFASVAPTPDLLNLLQLPRCSVSSMLPNSSISFGNPKNSLDIFGEHTMVDNGSASNPVLYDPPLHLNLPPQPPIFKELFNTLPHGYSLPNSRGGGGGSYFDGVDERDGLGGGGGGGGGDGVYQDGNGRVLDFSREVNGLGKRGEKGPHFATEKQRREQLNEKYTAMRQLIPNPTKADRASIVADATEYIKELQRTVEELKILVDKKRCGRDRCKKLKTEDDGDMESSSLKPLSDREQSNVPLRCSWLQRKYKDTEVDVRIVDDEVTIKLIQKKKVNCLLTVSKILDELQLDLLHVSGGNIGVNYSFLFNTKIYEGSSVYAGAIAKKLLEAVDKNYATFPPAGF